MPYQVAVSDYHETYLEHSSFPKEIQDEVKEIYQRRQQQQQQQPENK